MEPGKRIKLTLRGIDFLCEFYSECGKCPKFKKLLVELTRNVIKQKGGENENDLDSGNAFY